MSFNLIHASCVAIDDEGVLLAGPSGIGKSDLALRLIDGGALLVADDRTHLCLMDGVLMAASPPSIAGFLEVRHVGILRLPYRATVSVSLYVDLAPPDAALERFPEPEEHLLLDRPVKRLRLKAVESSTPAKICAALAYTAVE